MSKITSVKSEIDNTYESHVTLTVSIMLDEPVADYFLRVTPNGCTIDKCYNKEGGGMNRLNYYCRPFCGIPVDENNKVIINLPMILKMVTLAVRCPQRVPWDKRHKAGKEFWNGYREEEE